MNDKYTKKRLQKTVVSKWQLKRRQRSEAQLQRAAAAATSASEIPEASRVEAFFFFPLQHFFEPFSLIHVRFPTFLCSPPPPTPPPFTLGFSAGKLPAWPQRRCICLQRSRFGSALFLRPFAGFTAECEQGMPLTPRATSSSRPAAFSRRPPFDL